MSTPIVSLAEITQNAEIAPDIYMMELQAPEIAQNANPGQFLHIRCSDTVSPLLRRPISIADVDEKTGKMKIIYRVVGEGTHLLCQKTPGNRVDIIGPLGKGFPLPDRGKTSIIIGGGIGVAPLLYLAKKIAEEQKSDNSPIAMLGFATKQEAFGIEFLKSLGIKVIIATDDGTLGHKGFPTELLEEYFKQHQDKPGRVFYACGPKLMLSGIKAIAARENIRAYFSLEERMACGVGACIGCSVKSSREGYKKVCKDGPVFEAGEIMLDFRTANE